MHPDIHALAEILETVNDQLPNGGGALSPTETQIIADRILEALIVIDRLKDAARSPSPKP